MSEDSDFKETKLSMCCSLFCEDEYLDGELRKGVIEKCILSYMYIKDQQDWGRGVVGVWGSRNGGLDASAFLA